MSLKVMFATDLHLGYKSQHKIRSNDSFLALQELLQLAQQHDVDILLIGGDMFDVAQPSQDIIYNTMKIMQPFVFSDRFIKFSICSDNKPNLLDPNFNIGLPIFSINGNHDCITEQNLTILDVLHESKYLNLIGKWKDNSFINISPITFTTESTVINLYALSNMKDSHLNMLF